MSFSRPFNMNRFVSAAILVGVFLAGGVSSSCKKQNAGHKPSIIKSGDLIFLRSTHSNYLSYLLCCTESSCQWKRCSEDAKKSSTCLQDAMFVITAKGKMKEPIYSGDPVSLSSKKYGFNYRLGCNISSNATCYLARCDSMFDNKPGNNWLKFPYATFQIYSKDEEDGMSPLKDGDVVGLKFQYSSNSAWLTISGKHFYPRSCSRNMKTSCAKENSFTGFTISKNA